MKQLTSKQECELSYRAITQLQANFTEICHAGLDKADSIDEQQQFADIQLNVHKCVYECYYALVKQDSVACEEIYNRVLKVYIDLLDIESKNI
tara:strand:- start:1390 stop:1668 length:279 start_codon:yes stop_codon:yes gene_type:complete